MNFDSEIIFDQFTRDIIRRKIRRLTKNGRLTRQDQEDLEQEMLMYLVRGLRRYDPARAHPYAFVTTLIERAVAQILRAKKAKKRDSGSLVSMEAYSQAEGQQNEPSDDGDSMRKRSWRSAFEHFDLAHDLGEILQKLPAADRELAERLKNDTVSQVARDLGIPRTTLQRRVQRLRRSFEDTDLRNYL